VIRTDSAIAVFKRLAEAGPPEHAATLSDTACVLGGSVAGLLAARVLADHARKVIVVERDAVSAEVRSRPGVPQDQQPHTLLPGGLRWMERWLPGLTREMQDDGAVLAGPGQHAYYLDGQAQVEAGRHELLTASRPLIESRIRARVLALPNVTTLRAQATGLKYTGGTVSGVHYRSDQAADVLAADFVVDAMGRTSKLSDWLFRNGYDYPRLHRLRSGINYASAVFKRTPRRDERAPTAVLARFSPSPAVDGVAVAAVNAIENDQWHVMLMGYDDDRPGRTLEAFQETCAKLPPVFGEAASDPVTGEILTYHQADSRRRDFTGLRYLPSGLISVGDAVASFNPVYEQGMAAAALHASCLSEFLRRLTARGGSAAEFFQLEEVVTDAAWTISAGGDAARLDALSGAEVPADVASKRQVLDQLARTALVDEVVSEPVQDVSFMVAHPDTLADPALFDHET
jgi:2-polyprenyl-6-methoxyphenol hydroxylase-like FAD-dependent oxidoreductase